MEAESFTRVTVLSVVSTGSAVEAESLTGVKEESAASGTAVSSLREADYAQYFQKLLVND